MGYTSSDGYLSISELAATDLMLKNQNIYFDITG